MRRTPQPQPDGSTRMVLTPISGWYPGELVDCDAVGMGFCLIHRRVFEAFKGKGMTYFRWTFGKAEGEEGLSEDFMFCQDAKKLGFKTYVDTGVVCSHQGIGVIQPGGVVKISDIP